MRLVSSAATTAAFVVTASWWVLRFRPLVSSFVPPRPIMRGGAKRGWDVGEVAPGATSLISSSARTARRATLPHAPSTRQSSASQRKGASAADKVVVYQKVIRPPPGTPDVLFLGYLVEYLQDRFEIPERLPMVYRMTRRGDDDDESSDDAGIVQWNSPLSPSPSATAMSVEVVGIYTADESLPSMAMVVVEKAKPTNPSAIPPMVANLFADAEKKILKALDRGLDDFMAGEISNLGGTSAPPQPQSDRQGRAALLAELVPDDEASSRPLPPRETLDADMVQKNGVDVTTRDKGVEAQQEAAVKNTAAAPLRKSTPIAAAAAAAASTIQVPRGLDFAVHAAKLAQAKRKRQKESGAQEYAVQAAREAAFPRANGAVGKQEPAAQKAEEDNDDDKGPTAPMSIDLSAIRPPALDPDASGVRRAFTTTISTPGDYMKSQISARPPVKPKTAAGMSKSKNHVSPTLIASGSTTAVDPIAPNASNRTVNLKRRDVEGEPTIGSNLVEETNEIMAATQEALNEMAENGVELSPEELLAEVMKFGEQEERKQAVGEGFVSGAFEKAKNLLRRQKELRDSRMLQDVTDQVKTDQRSPLQNSETRQKGFKELTPEEELRNMFAAGERIADGRIATALTANAAMSAASKVTEKEVDDLIDSDKTVSRYARVLDDELAELEVRINKSPGEQLDGPVANPMFDIFSGPEVYDPNVDPLTAVNWPGAQPGTKNVLLPKELDEAVKQAKFAVQVLMSMREVDANDDGPKTFIVGKRVLSPQQISRLRSVMEEAVEIGLIPDPVEIQAEQARLQMLLDELASQPEERMREIASNYKDLMLSEHFVDHVRRRLNKMADDDLDALRRDDESLESAHVKERELLVQLVVYAQLLLKEVRALGAELESQQLEVIRSICKVALDPVHQTEEETALALTDAVRDMRPLFDDAFVAYLKYAVAEEEGRLARAGLLDDPEHNQWLFVLKIVQQGVYAEISKGINRYVDHIWYILRMETPIERRMLLEKLVDVMPTLDVRPFVQVVESIVGALGDGARGEFDGVASLGEMTNKLLQLHRDLKAVLPPDRIAEKSRDADQWAAKQKHLLLEQRNLTKQRLKAAQATEHLDGEVDSFATRGEYERFD